MYGGGFSEASQGPTKIDTIVMQLSQPLFGSQFEGLTPVAFDELQGYELLSVLGKIVPLFQSNEEKFFGDRANLRDFKTGQIHRQYAEKLADFLHSVGWFNSPMAANFKGEQGGSRVIDLLHHGDREFIHDLLLWLTAPDNVGKIRKRAYLAPFLMPYVLHENLTPQDKHDLTDRLQDFKKLQEQFKLKHKNLENLQSLHAYAARDQEGGAGVMNLQSASDQIRNLQNNKDALDTRIAQYKEKARDCENPDHFNKLRIKTSEYRREQEAAVDLEYKNAELQKELEHTMMQGQSIQQRLRRLSDIKHQMSKRGDHGDDAGSVLVDEVRNQVVGLQQDVRKIQRKVEERQKDLRAQSQQGDFKAQLGAAQDKLQNLEKEVNQLSMQKEHHLSSTQYAGLRQLVKQCEDQDRELQAC